MVSDGETLSDLESYPGDGETHDHNDEIYYKNETWNENGCVSGSGDYGGSSDEVTLSEIGEIGYGVWKDKWSERVKNIDWTYIGLPNYYLLSLSLSLDLDLER